MGTSLFGRDAELARFRAVLGEACADGGWVILVAGEAGIGKSRLAGRFAAMAREAGFRVLVGRTTEDDAASPYWPWLQVLAPLGRADLLLAPAGADPQAERVRPPGRRHVGGIRRSLARAPGGPPPGRPRLPCDCLPTWLTR